MQKFILILLIILPNPLCGQELMDFIVGKVFQFEPSFVANQIAYPVNHGSMKGYHDANPFGVRKHLGADINGLEQGNSDLGDTVYSIGNGKVIYLFINEYYKNIGLDSTVSCIIIILHKTKYGYITSLYRHCQKPLVAAGEYVRCSQPISTIGTDGNTYSAHLHFEIRTNIFKTIENGYGDPEGYVDPVQFIKNFNHMGSSGESKIANPILNLIRS